MSVEELSEEGWSHSKAGEGSRRYRRMSVGMLVSMRPLRLGGGLLRVFGGLPGVLGGHPQGKGPLRLLRLSVALFGDSSSLFGEPPVRVG